MNRRRFLATTGISLLSGCLSTEKVLRGTEPTTQNIPDKSRIVEPSWLKQYGSAGTPTMLLDVIRHTNEGYIAVGHNNFQPWILKVGFGGEVQWSRTIDDREWEVTLNSITSVSDGGYAICGTLYPTNDTTPIGGVLLRVDKKGRLLWHQVYEPELGEFDYRRFSSIVETTDGNYVCVGQYLFENKYIGPVSWVVWADSKGRPIWQRFYGNSVNVKTAIEDGPGVIIGGRSFQGSLSPEGAFIDRITEAGLDWRIILGESNIINDISEISDNKYIAVGDFDTASASGPMVLRLDSSGDVLSKSVYLNKEFFPLKSITSSSDKFHTIGISDDSGIWSMELDLNLKLRDASIINVSINDISSLFSFVSVENTPGSGVIIAAPGDPHGRLVSLNQ